MGENDSAEKVKLNLMSLDGKRVNVLGILFGGQGTNNVPSWSPDSSKVAVVIERRMEGSCHGLR